MVFPTGHSAAAAARTLTGWQLGGAASYGYDERMPRTAIEVAGRLFGLLAALVGLVLMVSEGEAGYLWIIFVGVLYMFFPAGRL